jgi:hypothetical protein
MDNKENNGKVVNKKVYTRGEYGCKFCRYKGNEWQSHRYKNDEGHIICMKAKKVEINTKIATRFSSNSSTFVFYQYNLLKK